MKISVVINTYNRAMALRNTLTAFKWQDYPYFEIVVVNGPSTDDTELVLTEFAGSIKVASCPVANISVSRNIGIAHASGEAVAFIDDDGIPYPNWLAELANKYESDDVGGVGGFVWDHTGMEYQSRYITCDRFGEARFYHNFDPSDYCSFPGADWYPSLMGVNSSFRREVLLKIGGFNEVYAYFLDETDVCLRVIDKGYKIVFAPEAKVHHKYLASHIRDSKRRTKAYYPIVRSKGNFIMTHGSEAQGADYAEKRLEDWVAERYIEVGLGHLFRDYSNAERVKALSDIAEAHQSVTDWVGFENRHLDIPCLDELKPFPALASRLRVVLISADFPPLVNGGIGTLMKDVSSGLAVLGHEVHVVARDSTESVDFEEGAWVHRIKPKVYHQCCLLDGEVLDLPPSIKDWALTARARVDFIHEDFGFVDVVISPIWDMEGAGGFDLAPWKSIVTLHTTYAMSVDSHPDWTADKRYFETFVQKMVSAEKSLLMSSLMMLANSEGVLDAIKNVYGIAKENLNVVTVPHGVRDLLASDLAGNETEEVRGLFVGRLELRKGVDVLFDELPSLLDLIPTLSFDIVGDDSVKASCDQTLLDKYRSRLRKHIDSGQLRIHGKVGDDALAQFYNSCDFFVAPSRFESFGLVLAEAMSCGKPVVACSAGGMAEVVGDAGLLAIPGDNDSLRAGLIELAQQKSLRETLGNRARNRYEALFSVSRMSEEISSVLEGVVNDNQN